jgi:hypothetical protein
MAKNRSPQDIIKITYWDRLLMVQHNQTGLLGDGAGTITLVSIPPNPSAITTNDTDVDLKFGTCVTFDGVTLGTITCDATVLSRDAAGNPVCP